MQSLRSNDCEASHKKVEFNCNYSHQESTSCTIKRALHGLSREHFMHYIHEWKTLNILEMVHIANISMKTHIWVKCHQNLKKSNTCSSFGLCSNCVKSLWPVAHACAHARLLKHHLGGYQFQTITSIVRFMGILLNFWYLVLKILFEIDLWFFPSGFMGIYYKGCEDLWVYFVRINARFMGGFYNAEWHIPVGQHMEVTPPLSSLPPRYILATSSDGHLSKIFLGW